jgi:Pyruvate/2-oxoacid:ferredoxin oxidoreductase delta subunit
MNIDDKYRDAAEAIANASTTPLPINDTLLLILKRVIPPGEVDLVNAFRDKRSQTLAELVVRSGLSERVLAEKLDRLAKGGVIFNQPNRQGVMVYRLLPVLNVGTFEYLFMKKLDPSPENQELARLFGKLFDELKFMVQVNYDTFIDMMEQLPVVDRTVPVLKNQTSGKRFVIEINQSLGTPQERVIPTQEVAEIIGKFSEIALGHCFCRHHMDLLGNSCKQTKVRENCFTFGKSARYTVAQGFSRMVSPQEALKILRRAEQDGLVHKAYHPNSDISKEETSICNCCKCCCVQSRPNLIAPTINATRYVAKIDRARCNGCGICLDKCQTEAISLNRAGCAEVAEAICIGCGICANVCPQEAFSLSERDRIVRIPPIKKSDSNTSTRAG